MNGRTLDIQGGELMLCTDGGCRPALLADLADVIELLPSLLMLQDRAAQRRHWRLMAEQQRKAAREGRGA